MSSENDMMSMNGMNNGGINNLNSDSALHPFGVIPDGSVPDAGSHLTNEQAEQLRNGGGVGERDGRSMTGSGPGGSNQAGFNQSYAGGTASSMPPGL